MIFEKISAQGFHNEDTIPSFPLTGRVCLT